jgi:hypothetical protein
LIGRPRTWLFHQIAADLLRDVTSRCEAAGIPLLPVKGVVTAHLLYADVADRPLTDVDIRIRPRDFQRFRRLGRASSWRCVRVARTYHNLIYEFPTLSLDVEGHVGPPGLCALTVDAMLSRAVTTDLTGLRMLVPEVHDHAVLLVVNVFKDKLDAAAPHAVADVERIIEHPSFDRATFLERVVESRIATITWLVAGWMESRGSGRWGEIRTLLEKRPVRRLYGRLFRSLLPSAGLKPMALRLLARVGSDDRLMQGQALLGAFAWDLEMRLRSRFPAPRA